MRTNYKLKAFTMMELLVSMTLTGILVVFAFLGYNQIQKLFVNYSVQSAFISDYNQLNKALWIMADRADRIEAQNEKVIAFKTDSTTVLLDMNGQNILLKFSSHTDTFALEAKDIELGRLAVGNDMTSGLINSFRCRVGFQTQIFHVSFRKQYDATATLNNTLELLPPDEQP